MISPINMIGVQVRSNMPITLADKKEKCQTITPVQGMIPVFGAQALSQMPNVKFTGYGLDDLSAYANSNDPYPSEIEQRKYRLTVSAAKDIEQGDYLTAIKKKIHIADICRAQGKMEDADKLMDGANRLLRELPKYQIVEAINLISNY
ncbi:hypothetical protein IKP85_07415 [bacterium]|nr:hypothetical protein [bacterium]